MGNMQKQNTIQASVSQPLPELSPMLERLLCKVFDREASLFERGASSVICFCYPAAREFYATLSLIQKLAVDDLTQQDRLVESLVHGKYQIDLPKVDLWAAIEQRIDQEERNELFLGRRASAPVAEVNSSWFERLSWGMGGAISAAAMVLIFLAPQAPVNSQINTFALNNFTPVALKRGTQLTDNRFASNLEQQEPIRVINNRTPTAVEVDWMRSDGKVRLMRDPAERSPVIWVERRRKQGYIPEPTFVQRQTELLNKNFALDLQSPEFYVQKE